MVYSDAIENLASLVIIPGLMFPWHATHVIG